MPLLSITAGSGEIDAIEFGYMMKSLQRNNLRLLEKLGAPVPRNSSNAAPGGSGNDLMLAWRHECFAIIDNNKSGGVSCTELTNWLSHELLAGEPVKAPTTPSRKKQPGELLLDNRDNEGPYRRVDDRTLPPLVKASDLVSVADRAGWRLVQQRRNNASSEANPRASVSAMEPISPISPI
jgi:hypothetical protein